MANARQAMRPVISRSTPAATSLMARSNPARAETLSLRASRLAVTASHPVVNQPWNTRPEEMEALRRSGATEVARFTGPPPMLPPGMVFDLLDAEYVPLVGAEQLERPGPTLTIWSIPP